MASARPSRSPFGASTLARFAGSKIIFKRAVAIESSKRRALVVVRDAVPPGSGSIADLRARRLHHAKRLRQGLDRILRHIASNSPDVRATCRRCHGFRAEQGHDRTPGGAAHAITFFSRLTPS